MNNQTNDAPTETGNVQSRVVTKRMLQVLVQFLVIIAILFVASGRLDWIWAWVYIIAGILILLVNVLVLPRELIAERGRAKENVKSWDRLITRLSLITAIGMLVVAGLDQRYGWTPALPLWVHLLGLVGFVLGQGLFTWAMTANLYFSTEVRIQYERGHAVATGGPYRFVRHPGYVGMNLTNMLTPLLLGSLWALIASVMHVTLLVIRTALEDRTLQAELPGYKEYASQVRYRLVPGIW